MLTLNSVTSARQTNESGAFLVMCNVTDMDDQAYDFEYLARESDPHGLSPLIIQWLKDNPDFPVDPYVPPAAPSDEELRALMPQLSSRQFWLAALEIGITKTTVTERIKTLGLPPFDEARMITELIEATTFERKNPFLAQLTGLFGIVSNELDVLWTWASTI